ncbi:MAG: tRNA lysidine(34) synthetase TilS [Patescibacteria group bacterium]
MSKLSQKNLLQESENHGFKSRVKRSNSSAEGRTMRKREPRLSQRDLYFRFKKYIAENDLIGAGDKVVLACSGGQDSISLLYLLERLAGESGLEIIVAHFNHGIRGREADSDEKFVKKNAEKLNLKFVSAKANSRIKNEEQARDRRYEFLEKVRVEERAKIIAVAHNIDDLAETMLLNIIRGTGIRGLYSLRPKRGHIVRPLLFAEKNQLLSYLKEKKISYRTDSSNRRLVYTRNIIRHNIFAEITKINPVCTSAFARLSATSAEIDDFIGQYSLEIYTKLACKENKKIIIEQKKFTTLSPAIQKEIVRKIASDYGVDKDLTETQVSEVVALINKNIGKKEKILGSRLKIELRDGKIIVSKPRPVKSVSNRSAGQDLTG